MSIVTASESGLIRDFAFTFGADTCNTITFIAIGARTFVTTFDWSADGISRAATIIFSADVSACFAITEKSRITIALHGVILVDTTCGIFVAVTQSTWIKSATIVTVTVTNKPGSSVTFTIEAAIIILTASSIFIAPSIVNCTTFWETFKTISPISTLALALEWSATIFKQL